MWILHGTSLTVQNHIHILKQWTFNKNTWGLLGYRLAWLERIWPDFCLHLPSRKPLQLVIFSSQPHEINAVKVAGVVLWTWVTRERADESGICRAWSEVAASRGQQRPCPGPSTRSVETGSNAVVRATTIDAAAAAALAPVTSHLCGHRTPNSITSLSTSRRSRRRKQSNIDVLIRWFNLPSRPSVSALTYNDHDCRTWLYWAVFSVDTSLTAAHARPASRPAWRLSMFEFPRHDHLNVGNTLTQQTISRHCVHMHGSFNRIRQVAPVCTPI